MSMGSFDYLKNVADSVGLTPSLLRLAHLWCYSVWAELPIGNKSFHLTLRRIGILIVLAVVLPSLAIWNHVGFWLDDIFYPRWKEVQVENPVFVVGNARSGTTWLHRLLCDCKSSSSPIIDSKDKSDSSTNRKSSSPAMDYAFTTFRTWEILFAVPVTWKVWFHALYVIDQYILRGCGFYLVMKLEAKLVGHITVHPIGLMEAEEDEWLMMHIGLAQLLFFFFPAASELGNPLIFYDYHPDMMSDILKSIPNDQSLHAPMTPTSPTLPAGISNFQKKLLQFDRRKLLPLSTRLMILEYYHACIQRHLYFKQLIQSAQTYQSISQSSSPVLLPFRSATPPSPSSSTNSFTQSKKKLVFISKNPAFTLRLESLTAVFPSAKIICLLRDPVQSVPSMVSYISMVWHAFSSPTTAYPEARRLLGFCEAHYLYPVMQLHPSLRPSSSFAFVSYHHLTRDLVKTVTQDLLVRLFPSWQYTTNATVEFLQQEQLKTARYVSGHEYDFSTCCHGLSVGELQGILQMVYRVHKGYFPSQPMQ